MNNFCGEQRQVNQQEVNPRSKANFSLTVDCSSVSILQKRERPALTIDTLALFKQKNVLTMIYTVIPKKNHHSNSEVINIYWDEKRKLKIIS